MIAHRRSILIESPCNKICTVDQASGLCFGCGRSPAEIESWIWISSEERSRIMAELPQRLEKIRRPDAGEAT